MKAPQFATIQLSLDTTKFGIGALRAEGHDPRGVQEGDIVMEWRPIETVPRDGTPVVLFYPEGLWDDTWNDHEGRWLPDYAVMRWDIEYGERAGQDGIDNEWCWRGYYDATSPGGKPTHWTPLPDPPSAPPSTAR